MWLPSITQNKRILAAGFAFFLGLVAIGTIGMSPNILFVSVLYSWMALFILSIAVLQRSTMPILFSIAYFTFLLGKNTITLLKGDVWWQGFTLETALYVCGMLQVSIVSLIAGLYISLVLPHKTETNASIVSDRCQNVRNASTVLFYVAIMFKIAVESEVGLFVIRNSYLSLYTQFQSSLPFLFHKIADTSRLLFYIILVTYPTKRQLRLPLLLFLVGSFISITSGSRGELVVELFILIGYVLLRHFTSKTEDWITRRTVISMIVLAPVGIVLLSAYNGIRNGNGFDVSETWQYFPKFFEDQGGSWKIIAYAKQYENEVHAVKKSYSLGQLIYLYRYGFVGRLITGSRIPVPSPNSVFAAMDGTNLGATISQLVLGNQFLQGHGLGTQYIAELATDFGYGGVAIFNLLLGFFVFRLRYWLFTSKWYVNALSLIVCGSIISMPRNFAFSWLATFVSLNYWGIIIGVSLLAAILPSVHQYYIRAAKTNNK